MNHIWFLSILLVFSSFTDVSTPQASVENCNVINISEPWYYDLLQSNLIWGVNCAISTIPPALDAKTYCVYNLFPGPLYTTLVPLLMLLTRFLSKLKGIK